MKVYAYFLTTCVGVLLACYAAEYPSLLTEAKIGAIAVVLIIAGAMGVRANYEEEECEDAE